MVNFQNLVCKYGFQINVKVVDMHFICDANVYSSAKLTEGSDGPEGTEGTEGKEDTEDKE